MLPARAQDQSAADRGKRVVEMLRQDKFADVAADFNAQMTAALPASQLQLVWATLKVQAGEFQSYIDQQTQAAPNGITATIIGCQFERAALNVIVAFDAANKIAGLRFVPRPAPASADA